MPRIAVAIVSWGARVLARLAAGACWILVGPADPLPEYLGGTTVVGAVAWIVKVIDQRWSWQLPVTSQLQRIETQHWQRGGEILVPAAELQTALEALVRAGLVVPSILKLGAPPQDAPALDRKLLVYEPAFRASEGDVLEQIREPLRAASVCARVGGEDLFVAEPVVPAAA